MGPNRSGGPTGFPGIDPSGTCPKNPLDGQLLGNQNPVNLARDYEYVVNQRIQDLERRARVAEEKLKTADPDKVKLAEQLQASREKAAQFECDLLNMARAMKPYLARVAG